MPRVAHIHISTRSHVPIKPILPTTPCNPITVGVDDTRQYGYGGGGGDCGQASFLRAAGEGSRAILGGGGDPPPGVFKRSLTAVAAGVSGLVVVLVWVSNETGRLYVEDRFFFFYVFLSVFVSRFLVSVFNQTVP